MLKYHSLVGRPLRFWDQHLTVSQTSDKSWTLVQGGPPLRAVLVSAGLELWTKLDDFLQRIFALDWWFCAWTWHMQCDCARDQEKPGWQNRVLPKGRWAISAAELLLMPAAPPRADFFCEHLEKWEVCSLNHKDKYCFVLQENVELNECD